MSALQGLARSAQLAHIADALRAIGRGEHAQPEILGPTALKVIPKSTSTASEAVDVPKAEIPQVSEPSAEPAAPNENDDQSLGTCHIFLHPP